MYKIKKNAAKAARKIAESKCGYCLDLGITKQTAIRAISNVAIVGIAAYALVKCFNLVAKKEGGEA